MRTLLGTLLLLATLSAHAETLYVTERLPIALRAAFAEGSPVVKTVEGGAAMEVLDRADSFVQVRDAQGAEGWVEARFLTNAPPARPQLDRTQGELTRVRKELTEAQTRIKEYEEKAAQVAASVEAPPVKAPELTAQTAPVSTDTDFSVGWIILAFAMLGIGFGAGVLWVRERHRKRLGGMYLRI